MSRTDSAPVQGVRGNEDTLTDPILIGAMEHVTSAVVIMDLERRIRHVNPAFTDLLGYSLEQARTMVNTDFLVEDQHEMSGQAIEELVAGKRKTIRAERTWIDNEGHRVAVRGSNSLIRDRDTQEPIGLIVVAASVEAEKQARSDLIESESRWRFALETSRQGIWEARHDLGKFNYSPAWYELRGLKVGDTSRAGYQEWVDHIHPDDLEHVKEMVYLQDSGQLSTIAYEYRERHADGHWIWILCRGKPVEWDEYGVPTRIVGTDTDITQIKQDQEELERLKRRLELALSTSQVGIFEVDVDRMKVNWDERTLTLFGLDMPAGDVPDTLWDTLIHPDDKDATISRVDDAVARKVPYTMDYRVIQPGGSIRHVRAAGDFYTDVEGHSMLLGVNWDITSDITRAEELEEAKQLAERRAEELEDARARMEYNSLHDALTGLPNRRYLDQRLQEMTEAELEDGKSIAVLHIDLDRFKQINDTLGHAAGDAMLVHTAAVLTTETREDDFVARVGGDEFVVLLTGYGNENVVTQLARRITTEMSRPVRYNGHDIRFGVSIGITTAGGDDIDPRLMLVNADIALYRAKNRGRNRHEFFSEKLQSEVVATKKLADDILRGLEEDEFIAFYQLQFDARTRDVIGAEALVRWRHPSHGILPPGEFLQVAEDIGVAPQIDAAVLRQAIAAKANWDGAGIAIPNVSVNVSARRLQDEHLLPELRKLDIRPGTMSFELVESTFLDESDDIVNWNIDQIRELGIGIDIDDFGTGHASILGLLRLKPQRLKIDRQLVRPATKSDKERRLLKSIIDIGKSLDIQIVAEGISTAEHARIITELGCDALQGFALARPMTGGAVAEFVRDQGWRKAG